MGQLSAELEIASLQFEDSRPESSSDQRLLRGEILEFVRIFFYGIEGGSVRLSVPDQFPGAFLERHEISLRVFPFGDEWNFRDGFSGEEGDEAPALGGERRLDSEKVEQGGHDVDEAHGLVDPGSGSFFSG